MKKISLLFPLMFVFNSIIGQTYVWTQLADFTTMGRSYATALYANNKLYCGTGYNNGSTFQDFWEYDRLADAWTQKANFGGTGRWACVGFTTASSVYLGLGNDPSPKNDFWEYNIAANTWSQVQSFPGSGRYHAPYFKIGTKFYCGLGKGVGLYSDFYQFDPATGMWTTKTSFSGSSRQNSCTFSIGGYGYVVAGATDFAIYSDAWAYDPLSNTWSQKASLPSARYGAKGFSVNQKGYLLGGQTSTQYFNEFLEYDPVLNTWTLLTNTPFTTRSGSFTANSLNAGFIGSGESNLPNYIYHKDFWTWEPATALDNNEKNILLDLYPNPSDGFIRFKNLPHFSTAELKVADRCGRRVFEQHLVAGEFNGLVDLRSLNEGTYIYSFYFDMQISASGKVVLIKGNN